MEAKALFSGLASNSSLSSSRFTKTSLSSILLSPASSSSSFFPLRVSCPYRACSSISRGLRHMNTTIRCKNDAVERAADEADFAELFGSAARRKRLAVFVSGGGSNFRSIHEACLRGSIPGEVVVLVTNKLGCGGAEFARETGIPVILFPKTKVEPNGISPADLVAALKRFEVDFVLLAGYLKLLPVELIRAYPRSIVNIHPSLLPAFGGKGYYGMKVHEAVIASGARFSGPTIHFVDEHYDTGRILAQSVVPVLHNDTPADLAARVLQEEHRLYANVVAALCEDRITWREDGVPLIRSKDNANEYR